MPIELGRPKYFKYSECTEGQLLVNKGEFRCIFEGKFGDQYRFQEIGGQEVVLNKAGQLAWRIEQEQVKEGGYYDIYYIGSEVLEGGKFAGKPAHHFRVAEYTSEEIEEFTGVKAPKVAKKEGPTAPPPTIKETEDLDDLE